MIYGLAALEARPRANPERYGSHKRGARHPLALASFHEHLRYRPEATSINFGVYLQATCRQVARAEELQAHQVTLVIEPPSPSFDPAKAVRLAIAVNELVTHAVRYAFPDGQCGLVSVRLRPVGHGKPASSMRGRPVQSKPRVAGSRTRPCRPQPTDRGDTF